jgi:hypothetical protein
MFRSHRFKLQFAFYLYSTAYQRYFTTPDSLIGIPANPIHHVEFVGNVSLRVIWHNYDCRHSSWPALQRLTVLSLLLSPDEGLGSR